MGRKVWVRLGILGLVMGILTFTGAGVRVLQLHGRLNRLTAELETRREENRRLEQSIRAASAPDAVESRARTMLGLVRQGEQVFEPAVVVPPDDAYRVKKR